MPSVGWGEDPSPATNGDHKPLVDATEGWEGGETTDSAPPGGEVARNRVEEFPEVDPAKSGWNEKEKTDYDTLGASFKELSTRGDVPQWSSEARKYEWRDEYGEVGPEDPELEEELFKDTYKPQLGDNYSTISEIKAEVEGPEMVHQVTTMDEAGLHPLLLDNLKRAGYSVTTPIQAFCIPAAMSGHDVIGVAQTGSGKTVAYLAPILSKLMGKANKYAKQRPNPEDYDQKKNGITAEPLVLILVPTRELALQVYAEARRLCYRSKLRPSCVYGGGAKSVQINDLMRGCDILIGTPGRMRDIVTTNPDVVSLNRLRYTVFDEADELMDVDWDEQLAPLITGATAQYNDARQFLMFSATFSAEAREAAKKYLEPDYLKVIVGRLGSTHMNIHQVIIWTEDNMKRQALIDLLQALPVARTMIFCANIDRATELDDFLYRLSFPTNVLHSRLTQREREDAMFKFRRGSSPLLVTTHIGGRGIDVENVQHVINYDLPSQMHGGIGAYMHQIGRTGRIGNVGQATSFFNDRNEDLAPDLAKVLIECNHELPEFLQQYAPPDGVVTWDEDQVAPSGESTIPLDQADAGDPNILAESWGAWGSGDAGTTGAGANNNASAPAVGDDAW